LPLLLLLLELPLLLLRLLLPELLLLLLRLEPLELLLRLELLLLLRLELLPLELLELLPPPPRRPCARAFERFSAPTTRTAEAIRNPTRFFKSFIFIRGLLRRLLPRTNKVDDSSGKRLSMARSILSSEPASDSHVVAAPGAKLQQSH